MLAGIAVAAGAPWRDDSGNSTSASARTARDRVQREYAASVRSICTGVNAENAAVPARYRKVNRRLVSSAATLRVALIEELNRQLRGGDELLARLEAATPPNARARSLQAATGETWSRSLDRLRRERDALERARSQRATLRAATALSRSTAERDRRIRAGLLASAAAPAVSMPSSTARGSR